jgi:hypothetical protein
MSWPNTYVHNVLIALDCLGAALLFNHNDITISSMCRLVQLADSKADKAAWQLAALKLSSWQVTLLRWIAAFLEDLQKGHCAKAVEGDMQRAKSIQQLLEP